MFSRTLGAVMMRIGVALMAASLEVAAMAAFGLTETHHDILGIIGAIAVLIAVAAAALAGPLVGGLAALTGGIAFFGFVTDWGDTAPLTATTAGGDLELVGSADGRTGDRLRKQRAAAAAAEDEAVLLHARRELNLLRHLEGQHGDLRLAWRYLPNEDRLGISGDFYDAADTQDGGLAVVIGDVVGHGPDAAASAPRCGRAGTPSWCLVRRGRSWCPRSVPCWRARSRLRGVRDAVSGVVLQRRRACITPAPRHPAPLLLSDGGVERLSVRPELPLGLADAGDCAATGLTLPSAWSLLLYTDGLVEGHAGDGSQKRFGVERLVAQLQPEVCLEATGESAEGALDRVLDSVIMANGGPLPDDVAVFCVSKAA